MRKSDRTHANKKKKTKKENSNMDSCEESGVSTYGSVTKDMESLTYQVGGDHYKTYEIEPVVYITLNGIGYNMGNIIKYASRSETRGLAQLSALKKKVQDLQKIAHYAKLEEELAIKMFEI